MGCVNTSTAEYKELVKGMTPREEFVAKAVITKMLNQKGNDKLPSFIELKQALSDMYNTNKSGVNYNDFYGEVRAMFQAAIPSMSHEDLEERIKFVDKLELIRLREGKEVLTTFIDNTVYVAKSLLQDRGTQAYNDVRHEIFHVIFNNFLNDSEQEKTMESFKRWKPQFAGIQDKEELEEKMADTFETYRSSPVKSLPILVRDFFTRVLKFFGLVSDNYSDIKRLFDDVENGRFTRDYIKDSLVTRDKTIINKYKIFANDLDLFLQTKSFLLNNLNELMFPGETKTLSETNDRQLFINYPYKSALFQNNKDLFKLGLTKSDSLVAIQKRLETLKGDKSIDPQLDKVISALSDENILKDMYNYLQPFSVAEVSRAGELSLKNQINDDPTEKLLESDEEINSLEIGSKELINPVTKISEVVKDFLSSITYETTPGNFVNIDPGAGFISLLNMLGSLYGNNSVEDNLQSLKDRKTDTVKGNQSRAVFNKLEKLHEAVTSKSRLSLNIKGVDAEELSKLKDKLDENDISHETFKDRLTIVIPDTLKIENQGTNSVDNTVVFTFNRYKDGGESFLIKQKSTESNKTFVEKVANETGIPSFIISKLFRYNEQRNELAELTKVANSLRKLSPKFVKVSTIKVNDPDSGFSSNQTSYAFINKVNEYRSSNSLSSVFRDRLDIPSLRKDVVNLINQYQSVKKKGDKKELRTLLERIIVDKETGVNKLGLISTSDFQRISDKDVTTLLNNLERIVNFVPEINTDKASDEFKDSDIYLRQTSVFANSLTKYTFEKNNPTSFSVSTSNKQKWENVMPNTSYKIFKNLEDFALGLIKSDKLLPYLKNSFNNYLRYNPLFEHDYTNNQSTVNQSLLKVGDEDFYADHQETYFEDKNSFYEKPPVPFSKETPRDWINRNFLAMFQLPVLESLTANKKTERSGLVYFQQKFQPESAPNVSVVKMGINTAESLQNNIANMIIQEAYMNHLNGDSIRGNLVKNTKKSSLPGLEGSSYFIKDGVNTFFDGAGNINKEVGSVVNGKFVANLKSKILSDLVSTVMESLDGTLDQFVDLAITEKATLDGTKMADMYEKLKNSYPKAYQISDSELSTLRGFNVDAKTDVEALRGDELFQEQREVAKKAMSIYYLNSFVNGFFMNQLSSGATQNYKNPLDEVKRQAGVNAMNDTGLIDNEHGMRNNYKNVVIAAANTFYGQSNKLGNIKLLERFFKNKKQEIGDAQSWDIPEYKQMLRKSFGKSVDIGIVTKDVHFEINERGEVDYRKTSSAELTNEVVKNNKTLRDLRYALTFQNYLNSLDATEKQNIQPRIDYLYNKLVDNNGLSNVDEYMEYQDILKDADDFIIHKASFDSAIKGSKPSTLSTFSKNPETGTFDFNLESNSILNLNSNYNGIQQAIRHRYIDSFISHFTQLTYLIGLNRTDTSIKNQKNITRTLSKFAKAGMFDTLFDYRMSYGDDKTLRANTRSKKEFITDLKKKLDLPGNERIVSLLNTKGISMNNPLFSEKLMQSFFNSFTKKTVSPKHPGGSFVLQSEFGFEANRALSENSLRTPEMVVDKDNNILYAECYLPEMYSDQLKNKDLIYYNSDQYNKMFGFRIPSSDLHSSVPLKVIGYYPSSSHDNIVVIPAAVTALHGSDFDVDKLFVVRQGVFGVTDEDKDPKAPDQTTDETSNKREYKTRFQKENKVIAQKGIKFGYTAPEAKYDDKGNIVDFGPEDKHSEVFNMDNIIIDEKQKTQDKINDIEKDIEKSDREKTHTKFERSNKTKEVKGLTDHLKQLRTIQKGLYSNNILNSVLDNISYSGENAEDILFGITFDPVKGYEEESEYSQLARVYSDINKAKGIEDTLPERPTLYKSLDEATPASYAKIKNELTDKLGVDITTEAGKADLLSLVNEDLKDNWVSDRDEFIRRQRGTGAVNINKVEDHVTMHKETYMAAGLVGLIANFSKGLAYAFHGITDGTNAIELDIPEKDVVVIDGQKFNSLALANKDKIKTQEIRSLALNAAIDHVKEQILNVLNVGNNTAKIFLAAVSTEMNLHQTTMLMLQPVAKELNSSNATRVGATLNKMAVLIQEKLAELGSPMSQEDVDKTEVNTKDLEKFIQQSFTEMFNDTENPSYKKNLKLQYKVLANLSTLENIGNEVSAISSALSIIQGLPYNLETAYAKMKDIDKFIDVEKFFNKLEYQEKSEYTQNGFKDNLRSSKTILKNVNLANNENVLGALEAIKMQVDVASEMFSENSVQAQFLVNNMIKAVSNNSDPSTMFTGENDENLTFDTVKNMSIQEKYLKGKNTFNMFKVISRNIFNYMTSGMNISFNNDAHLFSLGIQNQGLTNIVKTDEKGETTEYQLGAVKSYLNTFLMKEGEVYDSTKNYDGDKYLVSQINPEWRIKPLALIKQQNQNNKFLRGVGIDTNFRDKVRVMTFNNSLVNTAENLAEIEQAVNMVNSLNNIYVRLDKKGRWVDVPASLHPDTNEMNEVVFNILKTSLYTDKFKFSSSKATNVIPPVYYQKIFQALETLTKDLIYYQKSNEGNKYYKDFSDLNNQSNERSALSDIKENLFINTIFSIPTVLPNLRSMLSQFKGENKWKAVNRQAGFLPNGNIYDLYFDANILDKTETPDSTGTTLTQDIEKTGDNTNVEVDQDVSETQAETDLFESFRKNPSFIADESYKKPGSFELFMKVGSTGTKEGNDLKYYYKKIGFSDGKITNNSFDTNLLINRYQIKDYYNPKRIAIPMRDVDFSGEKVKISGVKISSFMISSYDDIRTGNLNKEQVKQSEAEQFELLKAKPENKFKTDEQIKAEVKTKINIENLINQTNEVSLYDSRNLDRVGIRNFKVVNRQISADKKTVSFDLEALPLHQQIRYNRFESPLEMLKTLKTAPLTAKEETAQKTEVDESSAINKVLEKKKCK